VGQQLSSYQGELEKTREWTRTVFCLAYLYIVTFFYISLGFHSPTMVIFIGGALLC
jgi:hypothetical protein